jgi:type IV pilus assembly protein PilW
MNIPAQARTFIRSPRQAGLSLVELMVSITIGMFLLLGLASLLVQQSSTSAELEKSSRQIENGRYAMQLLHDDIQLAGYYGDYSPPATGVTYTTPDPCDLGGSGWDDTPLMIPLPIVGYTGTDAEPACVTNRLPGTGILVVRRTATTTVDAIAAVAGTPYIQVAKCDKEARPFVMASAVAAFNNLHTKACAAGALAPVRKYIVRIYYLSSCDVCASDNIPTLKMVEIVDGVSTPYPLVEGIENMQFEYGLDNVGTLDGAPDSYESAPTAAQWQDVVAVRVNLLARNIDPTAGYTDTKIYITSAVAPGGSYKRHAFSELTRVVNVSGRRERP